MTENLKSLKVHYSPVLLKKNSCMQQQVEGEWEDSYKLNN